MHDIPTLKNFLRTIALDYTQTAARFMLATDLQVSSLT